MIKAIFTKETGKGDDFNERQRLLANLLIDRNIVAIAQNESPAPIHINLSQCLEHPDIREIIIENLAYASLVRKHRDMYLLSGTVTGMPFAELLAASTDCPICSIERKDEEYSFKGPSFKGKIVYVIEDLATEEDLAWKDAERFIDNGSWYGWILSILSVNGKNIQRSFWQHDVQEEMKRSFQGRFSSLLDLEDLLPGLRARTDEKTYAEILRWKENPQAWKRS